MSVSGDPDRLARLRWRSRRGMRELDALLMAYLEQAFPAATPGDLDELARQDENEWQSKE